MAKVGGTYPSVVMGVSQQEPQDRRPGQMGEQDNMLPDPVRGLTRRRATRWLDEINLGTGSTSWTTEAQRMREFAFAIDSVEFCLLYRAEASALGEDKFLFLFNKTTGAFIPVTYENSTWVDDLIAGGVSAVTCVGRYLYIAGNTTIPTATQVDVWNEATNKQKLAAWIRSGAYSRKYTVTLVKPDGTTVASTYETKPSAYPELLDTSDIPFYIVGTTDPDPEYQKHVNDRVNEYNGLVNEWIKISAEDIQPQNIAQKLVDLLILDHGVAASAQSGHVLVDDADYVDIKVDDGADGQTFVAVGKEVSDPTRVTRVHWNGKIIRVRPKGAAESESYYLRAVGDDGATGWTEVTWYEAAGVVQTVTNAFAQLIIHDGTAYVAQSGAGLEAIAPSSGEHPDYKVSVVGDGTSAPLPNFIGRVITMLSVFQDRLLIGTNGIVNCSRPGDYLNYFRQTVLTIADNDPIEMFAQGSEGDTLRASVLYDKDLVIFGDLKQYAISGRQALSAKAPSIAAISAHKDTTAAHPIAVGNFVFYGNDAEESGRTSLHQLQVGNLTSAPVGYEVSQQLDSYLVGSPVQMTAITSPNIVALRTRDNPQSFYMYRYVDDQSGGTRVLDAWHKFTYAPVLGTIIGVSTHKGDFLVFTMRPVPGSPGGTYYVVADRCSVNALSDGNPHLDSWRSYGSLDGWHASANTATHAAARKPSPFYLVGAPMSGVAELIEQEPEVEDYLNVGVITPALAEPTNPYPRDSNDKPIMGGTMSLSGVVLSLKDTGGFSLYRSVRGHTNRAAKFEGRIVEDDNNLLGTQPLFGGQYPVTIAADIAVMRWWIESESWLPLRVTGIEWTGQHFYRVRRVS